VTHFTASALPPPNYFSGRFITSARQAPSFWEGAHFITSARPPFFGGRRTSWLLPPRAMNPIVTPLTFDILRLCTRLLHFQQPTNQPSFPPLFFDVHSLCSTQNTYTYTVTSSRISGYSNGSEGRIAADAAHMSCIGLRLQGGPKNWGHRLMTTILSNLNRFKKFYFHWKIPS